MALNILNVSVQLQLMTYFSCIIINHALQQGYAMQLLNNLLHFCDKKRYHKHWSIFSNRTLSYPWGIRKVMILKLKSYFSLKFGAFYILRAVKSVKSIVGVKHVYFRLHVTSHAPVYIFSYFKIPSQFLFYLQFIFTVCF